MIKASITLYDSLSLCVATDWQKTDCHRQTLRPSQQVYITEQTQSLHGSSRGVNLLPSSYFLPLYSHSRQTGQHSSGGWTGARQVTGGQGTDSQVISPAKFPNRIIVNVFYTKVRPPIQHSQQEGPVTCFLHLFLTCLAQS